jgi:2-dehydro-3-deoxygalactonokinase
MDTVAPASPALIGLDWGTTSLRAYLIDVAGSVMAERAEPWGIMRLGDRDFSRARSEITTQWAHAGELPVIACGMVGSALGWVEVPYCTAPAGALEIGTALVGVPGTNVHIVPGVSQYANADVMRGEETQIIGALSLHDELERDSRVVCPGTHSKWVTLRNGRIDSFTTYMTGELYAVLTAHSILGRLARNAVTLTRDVADDAFRIGVRTARDSDRDSAALLFSARARVLLGEVRPEASLDYLSGVLIGGEVRDGLNTGAPPAALIGDAALCVRYVDTLREFNVADTRVIAQSAPAGLWRIAESAGLCTATWTAGQTRP